ncbi:MAG: TolC family protein, partial [Gloeobacteraceae cyanobacterium ES-bin-316]|nr:TolC family protein [Ferruginibacter sp.]
MIRNIIAGFLLCLVLQAAGAQQLLTEADAIARALGNNKNIKASSLEVKQQEQLLRGTTNLPNPEFFLESPTGNFYTGSITQSIEFPTVYSNQRRLQKETVSLAQKEKQLTSQELIYQVKLLYLEAQFRDSLVSQLYLQDTLYEKIKVSAIRQFDAGQIDYLQQTFAEIQYGEIHNEYLQAVSRAKASKTQLQWVTGVNVAIVLEPLEISGTIMPNEILPDSTTLTSNISLQLLQQQTLIAKQNIALQKSKSLPGLAFGYFNQGERETKWFNRFRLGLTVPLWYGQYKANINAAKTEQAVIEFKQQGLRQELTTQLMNAQSDMQTSLQSLQYYQETGLKKAREILSVSQRFFESGEIDFINLMRNNNEAYSIFQK